MSTFYRGTNFGVLEQSIRYRVEDAADISRSTYSKPFSMLEDCLNAGQQFALGLYKLHL